jgi:quinol-cytochrome oxidoreductase complex cytochrome b subunit
MKNIKMPVTALVQDANYVYGRDQFKWIHVLVSEAVPKDIIKTQLPALLGPAKRSPPSDPGPEWKLLFTYETVDNIVSFIDEEIDKKKREPNIPMKKK